MKTLKKLLTIISLSLIFNSFAFSQTALKGKDPVMNIGVPEIVDYKGKAIGSEIPAWVKAPTCMGAGGGLLFQKLSRQLPLGVSCPCNW